MFLIRNRGKALQDGIAVMEVEELRIIEGMAAYTDSIRI